MCMCICVRICIEAYVIRCVRVSMHAYGGGMDMWRGGFRGHARRSGGGGIPAGLTGLTDAAAVVKVC